MALVSTSPRLCGALLGTLIALAASATYFPVLHHDFVRWDDPQLILENPLVQRFTPRIFFAYDPELYIPLTLLTFQVEHALAGFSSTLFHLDNLLLHGLNAVLVFVFLSIIFRERGVAFLGALLFAVHPLHAETVSWVSARKELLFMAFTLASLTAYLSHEKKPDAHSLRFSIHNFPWLSLVLFLLALLAKPTAIVFPLLLVLLAFRRNDGAPLRVLRRAWPFTLLALLFTAIALMGQRESSFTLSPPLFLLFALQSSAFSLWQLVLPWRLSALYPAPPVTFGNPVLLVTACTMIGILWLLWSYRKQYPDVMFGMGFFFTTLAPSLLSYMKADTITFTADRYAYLPSVGWIIAMSSIVMAFCTTRIRRIGAVLVVSVVLVFFHGLARAQSAVWRTTETLFRDVLMHYPEAHIAKNNLGVFYLREGRLDEALPLFLDAVRLRPSYLDPYLNLAAVYARKGMLDDAEENIRHVLALSPDDARAHVNLGGVRLLRGDWDGAILSYRTAIELRPDSAVAYQGLARAYLRKGMREEARAAYERALALQPDLRGNVPGLDDVLPLSGATGG